MGNYILSSVLKTIKWGLWKKGIYIIRNVFRMCVFKNHQMRFLNKKLFKRNIFKICFYIKICKNYLKISRCSIADDSETAYDWSLNVMFHLKMTLNDEN